MCGQNLHFESFFFLTCLIQIGNLKFHLASPADFRDEEDCNLCHLPPALRKLVSDLTQQDLSSSTASRWLIKHQWFSQLCLAIDIRLCYFRQHSNYPWADATHTSFYPGWQSPKALSPTVLKHQKKTVISFLMKTSLIFPFSLNISQPTELSKMNIYMLYCHFCITANVPFLINITVATCNTFLLGEREDRQSGPEATQEDTRQARRNIFSSCSSSEPSLYYFHVRCPLVL